MNHSQSTENPQIADIELLRHLDSLTEGSSAMLAINDLEHRFIYANRELEALLGATPGSMVGSTMKDWICDADAVEMEARETEVARSGISARAIEHFSVDGKLVSRATVRFPYTDPSGNIIGTGFIALDIQESTGEYSDMAQALKQAQDKIEALKSDVEMLRHRATTDFLTGVLNRGQIEENAEREIAMFQRYAHPISLIFIDIDHFKNINDAWGHAVGDEVLKHFCDVVRSGMRTTDLLGRWGGEEFILLLPNTRRMSASLVAERVRTALERHAFPLVGQVTASLGVATYRQGETLTEWIDRADEALYRAKSNGRNRTETDGDDGASGAEKIAPIFVGLVWQKAYESGNSRIDQQHRNLFEMSNQLLAAVLGGQPKDEVTGLINALLSEVVQHFADEEAIVSATGFPESVEHREIHAQLVDTALRLANQYAEDRLNIGDLFVFLAYEVVAKHMLADDRKFFPYLSAVQDQDDSVIIKP